MMRLLWLFLLGLTSLAAQSALAQTIPDVTLGTESSRLVRDSAAFLDRIEGGAIRGSNLFHSFSEFNINSGQRLYFANPATIQNIFTRVTGSNPSTISGVLGVSGTANLFLLNPNGVLFTTGAGLDLKGALVISTANAIRFGDRGIFSATNPQAPPLLNVAPSALLYTQIAQSGIEIQTRPFQGLDLPPGQPILLIGGNVSLNNGGIFAPGGRIEVGGLAGIGEIAISPDFQLSFPTNVTYSDVVLKGRSRIDGGDGGQVYLTGRNFLFDATNTDSDWSQIYAESKRRSANITLNAQGTIDLVGNRAIDMQTQGDADAGALSIRARSLIVRDGGSFRSLTSGTGRGAEIKIDAAESVQVFGTVPTGQSGFGSSTQGAGQAGDMTINTDRFRIDRGGVVASSALFGAGNAGNLTVNANRVEVVGTEFNQDSYISILRTETFSQGKAGDLTINTREFSLREGGLVSSRAFKNSTGRGGTLTINASESAEVLGTSQNLPFAIPSLLTAQTEGFGNAGTLNLTTKRLQVANGGRIEASTDSGALGGNINLRTDSLQLSNNGAIRAIASQPTGQAGNLNIQADTISLNQSRLTVEATQGGDAGGLFMDTRSLNLDRSQISVSSPQGRAGRLEISANQILLNQSRLTAETGLNQSLGAEIDLRNLEALVLRRGSQINASANNQAQGGNVRITSSAIVAVPSENSDIRANAFQGRGGNVAIATQALFGIAPANFPIALSDITASSELGLPGEVAIIEPDIQPTQGLIELPTDLIDVTRQIAQVCRRGLIGRSMSRFVVSGRGSAPPSPMNSLTGNPITPALATIDASSNRSRATEFIPSLIVEAQGWTKTPDGKIVLVAQPIEASRLSIAGCPSSS